MKIKFKHPVTTASGVQYPAGYTVQCDTLINLPNGFTALGVAASIHPSLPPISEPVMEVGVRDLHKLEITLDYPA